MTQAALKLTARVLPGKRIEFTAPELTEGDDVEIFVALPKASGLSEAPLFASAADYLLSLPVRHHTPEEALRLEKEAQKQGMEPTSLAKQVRTSHLPPAAQQPVPTHKEEPTGVWDWLQSLPPSTLTREEWAKIEQEMREEKEAWER